LSANEQSGVAADAATLPEDVRRAPRVLLLADHGTAGASRAQALAMSLAAPGETTVVHLYVVPDFWVGMQGDDWLNNAWTRDAFAVHVERQLDAEARQHLAAVARTCRERGLACESVARFGDPTRCLIEAAAAYAADLVMIGPPRPKGVSGYRSRIDLDKLVRGLRAPLLIASGQ
jgi:nucleotide-binding universal stress UspA family protein